MNILIAHGYALRLMRNNIVESAPVKVVGSTTIIDDSQWQQRSFREMDFTGGDEGEIKNQLTRLNAIFFDNKRRTPQVEDPFLNQVKPSATMGAQ